MRTENPGPEYPCTCAGWMPYGQVCDGCRRNEVQRLAAAFVATLRGWLTPEEWREMCARNRAEGDPRICHSHDFCDANMAMLAVFETAQRDPFTDDGNALWNAAWERAMPALRGERS